MPRPPPTNDARGCCDKFIAFLELNIKNRALSKQGAGQSLDVGTLANLVSNAALSHPSKPHTPASPARSRRMDLPVSFTTSQKTQLREVFIHYASWGERQNFMHLNRTQFLLLCRDLRLVTDTTDMQWLSLMYDKVVTGAGEGGGPRLTFTDFLSTLSTLASRLFPRLPPQDAVDKVIADHVLKFRPAESKQGDPLGDVVLQPEVIDTLAAAQPKLKVVFDFYLTEQHVVPSKDSDAWGFVEARRHLSLEAYMRFCSDYGLLPQLLTKSQLAEAFRRARLGTAAQRSRTPHEASQGPGADDPAAGDSDVSKLNFEEFMECMGRLALMAYNYQEPVEPPKVLTFKDAYQSEAKQLWMDDHRMQTEAFLSTDELAMPSATYDEAIGNEDRAHYDETRSMRRGPSGFFRSARSMAQYRTHPPRLGGGIDVMQVHAEAETLPTDARPEHLRSFSPDWVGRTGLTLGEAARLQKTTGSSGRPNSQLGASTSSRSAPSGLYTTDMGLPPIFGQRGAKMEEARVAREQAMEGLRLMYVAERRQQAQNKHSMQAARTRALQAASGQRVFAGGTLNGGGHGQQDWGSMGALGVQSHQPY